MSQPCHLRARLLAGAGRLLLVFSLGLGAAVGSAMAEEQTPSAEISAEEPTASLSPALQLDALFAVLRDEGLSYGTDLQADMFPGSGGTQWQNALDGIYAKDRLRAGFEAVLNRELAGDTETVAAVVAFFTSDLGMRAVSLEIDARRAFLDTASEEAARVAADARNADRDPKVALIRRFIEAGDLIEMNVAGSLSGNLAFMTGMSDSGAYGEPLPQEEMIAQAWGQEDQIRDDTSSWLNAYLGLAYHPLTEGELEAYIAFMESPAGQRLNAALFMAFDQVFRQVSYDLGRAAGLATLGQDI